MQRVCSKCGSELPDGAKFCSECGTAVTEAVGSGVRCPKCNSANVAATPKEYKPKLIGPLMLTFGGFGLMFLGFVGCIAGGLIGLVLGAIINCFTPQTYQTVITCADCGYSGVLKEGKK